MLTWQDKLKRMPLGLLERRIKEQKLQMATTKRDLETMEEVFAKRITNHQHL